MIKIVSFLSRCSTNGLETSIKIKDVLLRYEVMVYLVFFFYCTWQVNGNKLVPNLFCPTLISHQSPASGIRLLFINTIITHNLFVGKIFKYTREVNGRLRRLQISNTRFTIFTQRSCGYSRWHETFHLKLSIWNI